MKMPRVLAFLAAICLLAPVHPAGAQVPFNSTSPPNSNPFGSQSGGGLPPLRQPVQTLPQTQGMPSMAGAYPAAPVAYAPPQNVDPNHKLGARDILSYRVQEDREDKPTQLVVSDSGELFVPLIGLVKAAGKSTAQLSGEIKAMLEREYYYHATVVMGLDSVAPLSSLGRAFVTGAVKSQGAVDFPPGGTLSASQAIVQCGGFTDFANPKDVKVIRKGLKKPIIVNVKEVLQGKPDQDVVLEPGDTVKVGESWIHY